MNREPKKKHKMLRVIVILALIAAVIIYDGNTRLVTDEYRIGGSGLPQSFEGLRIVHLSDLHAARFGKNNARLFDAVRKAEPDIITVTGDLIDDEEQLEYAEEFFETLTAIAPTYYVSGNHEWAAGCARDVFKIAEERGVTVLRNRYVLLERNEERLIIAGVDDPNGLRDQKKPSEVVADIREDYPDDYILMLAHRDTQLDMWAELGVDAVLCGHAHGGLVRLPFTDGLVAPEQGLFPTYTAGIYTKGQTQMLVSRGIGGTHNLPRIFNNPEVVVAILTRDI